MPTEDLFFEEKVNGKKLEFKNDFQLDFLNEMPPYKTEVTTAVLDIIKKAEKKIRIIQPYV